jgi:ADP-ribose pyrophosphatase YjhB (NUDIX family)
LSYLAPQVPGMEKEYGRPDELNYVQKVTPDEYDRIARSMKQGRSHDITLYIRKDGGYIFIAKPFYPPGLFRAPSGGVNPNEDYQAGARREALEETGADIKLVKYILRIRVRFENESDIIEWTSHIFLADYINGDIDPHDKREIKEARLIYPHQIPGFMEKMKETKIGGLNYRAFLTGEMSKRLENRIAKT